MSENGQTTPKRGEQTAPDPAANIHTTPDRGARLGAPLEPDPDWDWYLNEAPAILGGASGTSRASSPRSSRARSVRAPSPTPVRSMRR